VKETDVQQVVTGLATAPVTRHGKNVWLYELHTTRRTT